MKPLLCLLFIFILFLGNYSKASEYSDGVFIYDIYFAEWNKFLGDTALVIIHNNQVTVLFKEGNITGLKQGMVLDKGILYKHKSGQWIITTQNIPDDINTSEVGGCSDGPSVIDFKNKIYWMC